MPKKQQYAPEDYFKILIRRKAHAKLKVIVAHLSKKLGRRYTFIQLVDDLAKSKDLEKMIVSLYK